MHNSFLHVWNRDQGWHLHTRYGTLRFNTKRALPATPGTPVLQGSTGAYLMDVIEGHEDSAEILGGDERKRIWERVYLTF